MAKGASKISGGGGTGSGGKTETVNNPLMNKYIKALNDQSHRWNSEDRKGLAAAIYSTTDIGDKLVFAGNAETIEYVKTGPNQWKATGYGNITAAEMRDIMLILGGNGNGTWKLTK